MFTLSSKNQWLVGSILLLAMLVTRAHITDHLLDASWAVFFLAGFYLRNVLAFGVFMAVAVAIDYVGITKFGVSDFCVSQAYVALVPAYGALFIAGRWLAGHYQGETLATLGKLVLAVVVGFAVSELISSGSFYAFSGKFAEFSVVELGKRLMKYAPHGLYVTGLYVTVGTFVHVAVSMVNRSLAHGK
ncbi:hypothetical protein [Thiothrix subterranea]|uniref:Cobalamin ABC transporter n=1 Tax=Thiothrix subterranea TaxID=2735563 RepID=A0AA51R613_9GAMM|nr:hypothetical protein [Thiothrix subterranea]MDQ5769041.1 hypothetical protein [Thiothrix subterranea]WML88400.1 hypothetical protein RCG00_08455 [Thiothrix subterranea]